MILLTKNLVVGINNVADGKIACDLVCMRCGDVAPRDNYSLSVSLVQDPNLVGGGPPQVSFLAVLPPTGKDKVAWTCKCGWAHLSMEGEGHGKVIKLAKH